MLELLWDEAHGLNSRRARELLAHDLEITYRRTDRLFAGLLAAQWLLGLVFALVVSPRTWAGDMSAPHIHVLTAVFLGGLIAALPIALALNQPGAPLTRHTIAVAQMLASGLLIHLTGGRLETHFHIFGSLAFLAIYRDWRVLVTATAVTAADHLLREMLWPRSIYGVPTTSGWRWLEHAAWVLFEVFFLVIACLYNIEDMRRGAAQTGEREDAIAQLQRTQTERARQTDDLRRAFEQLEGAQAERGRILDGTRQALTDLTATSSRMVATAAEQAVGARRQGEAVAQTVRIVEGVRDIARRTADGARSLGVSAGRAVEISRDGQATVADTTQALAAVRARIDDATGHITDLARRAANIGKIIKAVNAISDMTNLLAINAAIEAVHAGEFGRSFGAVALEIKALAEQTRQSTSQVREILDAITAAGDSALRANEMTTREMTAASKVVSRAGATIDTLLGTIAETASVGEEILGSAGRQLAGVGQIHEAMGHIEAVTRRNTEAADRIQESATALDRLSARLARLTGAADGNGATPPPLRVTAPPPG